MSEVGLDVRKRKAQALLVALAIQPGHSCTREYLRGLLWADSSEADAQNSLRNAIWALNIALGPNGSALLGADRRNVWITPDRLRTDVDDLIETAEAGVAPAELHADPEVFKRILPDLIGITDLFDMQLRLFAERVQRRVFTALERTINETADDEARIRLLQLLRAADPLNEALCRQLMLAFGAVGRVADALGTYQLLWNALDEMFGEEPSAETQEVIVRLKMRASPSLASNKPGSVRDEAARPCIVVASLLPAQDADRTGGLVLHDIRERCIASLTRFREWRIVDADHVADPSLAKNTGIYLLRLSQHGAGDDRRFLALLSDQSSGEVLWSETFADTLGGPSGEEVDAIRRLAMSLNIHLTTSGPIGVRDVSQHERAATYDRWIRAENLLTQFTPESWAQAEVELDALISEYPQFGRAYSSRAGIENIRQVSFPGVMSAPGQHLRALTLAAQALALDPMDSRAQLAMGWSCAMSGQFDRAELAFDLAYRYNENDPWTIASSAVGMAFCDRIATATERVRLLTTLGFRLRPAHWSYIAATRFMVGDYSGAVHASEQSQEITPDVAAWHAAALYHDGRVDAAAERAARFFEQTRAAWVGSAPPSRDNILAWLISAFPMRNSAHRRALENALSTPVDQVRVPTEL